ncbi:restriction endonuclease subunit S [Vibrio cholerae]|uniref:restriction endonuclease subunit S n=1 Tax=Vibrio cholerae TaxID=666 RepID=UPI00321A4B95
MSMSADTNPCNEGKIETSQSKITKSGFKPSEYGLVPNDWDVCKLGEIAHIYSGGTPNRKVPEYWDGQIPWVTTTLIDGVTIDNALEFISEKGVEFSSTRWCKAGTLLMAMYGQGKTRGKVGMLGFDATINQACAAIDLKDQESSKYIFHVLNSMYDKIRESSNSGGQENLSGSIIKGLSVPLPPKEEQTAIADALSDVDALIQELEKLIAKKQAIKTATMQQLLTGRTRLPQFAHHPDGRKKGYKPSELGEIPEDWEIYSLENVVKSTQLGGNYKNTDQDSVHPLIKMGNLGRGYIKLDKLEFIVGVAKQIDRLNYGDLLFNTRNTLELVGKVSVWRNELPEAYFNSNLMRICFKNELVGSNFYMNAVMNSESFVNNLSDIATGTTSVAAIYSRDLLQLRIALPQPDEQICIAEVLTNMDDEIQLLEKRLNKTRQIKQGMMQELLTGKTRLVKPAGAA